VISLTTLSLSLDGYPATVNSYPECNAVVNKAAAAVVGEARTAQPQKTMGAEDFSYFLEQRPGMTLTAYACTFMGDADWVAALYRVLLLRGSRTARRDPSPPQVRVRLR
jgi:metal-dependent amidase/aminoacylase/carboxypeptidase family protein